MRGSPSYGGGSILTDFHQETGYLWRTNNSGSPFLPIYRWVYTNTNKGQHDVTQTHTRQRKSNMLISWRTRKISFFKHKVKQTVYHLNSLNKTCGLLAVDRNLTACCPQTSRLQSGRKSSYHRVQAINMSTRREDEILIKYCLPACRQ